MPAYHPLLHIEEEKSQAWRVSRLCQLQGKASGAVLRERGRMRPHEQTESALRAVTKGGGSRTGDQDVSTKVAPGLLLLCCFAVPLATCQPQSQNEQGEDGGSCQAHPASHLPRPSFSAVVKPMEAMFVTRTTTYNPFWFALPTESANPGYLSNSARDTGIMNPSGSLLVHELLGGEHGCQARDPKTNLPPLVVDIGAHIGWFTMLAASYGCRVVAVEPQPHAHPFINASIVLNGWQGRVKTFHAACSDDSSVGMKMVNRHGWGNWDITGQ
eukprot:1174086-Rhodomonas_salina.1